MPALRSLGRAFVSFLCLLPIAGLAYFCLRSTDFCEEIIKIWETKPTPAHPEGLQTRLFQFLESFDGLLGAISFVVIVFAVLISLSLLFEMARPMKVRARAR